MNLVLGAGPAGLIAGYLLRIPVVGEVVGGQQAEGLSLGPRIFEVTEDSIKLFESLGIDWQKEVREYKVGYARIGSPTTATIPNDQFRLDYYRKTRDPNAETFPESCLSGGKNVITGIDLDIVVRELQSRVAVIPGRVQYIDRTPRGYQVTCVTRMDNFLKVSSNLPCESLISTIPLPILVKAMNKPVEMEQPKSKSTYFAWVYTGCFESDPFESEEGTFDYVYFADSTCLFHRATKIAPGMACLEFESSERLNAFIHDVVDTRYLVSHKEIKGAQLTNKLGLQEYQGITLLGRYGTWNHGVKLEDVVKEVYEYAGEMGIRPEGSSLWI